MAGTLALENVSVRLFNRYCKNLQADPNTFRRYGFAEDFIAGGSHRRDEFRFLMVTYGTTSAPYLVIRMLLQLTSDEEYRFPFELLAIQENTYVDDWILSKGDMQEALASKIQIEALLMAGGFELSK